MYSTKPRPIEGGPSTVADEGPARESTQSLLTGATPWLAMLAVNAWALAKVEIPGRPCHHTGRSEGGGDEGLRRTGS